jgi:hypothetical protein
MTFDEARYVQDFIKKYRDVRTLPDDLLTRYAITLPATDADVAARVKAVRAYWNSKYTGTSTNARLIRMCRAEDQRLQAEHGAKMLTRAWWEERKTQRQSAAEAAVKRLADDLRQKYGQLGVVTAGTVDRYAAKLSLDHTDAARAAEQAGLRLVGKVTVPAAAPIPNFPALAESMSQSAARSVPELVHPGGGTFKLLDRYVCTSDPAKRLDPVAVEAQIAELDKHGVSATDDAKRAGLRILRTAAKAGVDLRDIALYHLVTMAHEFVGLSLSMSVAALQQAGLDAGDAAVITVLLDDQSFESGEAGLGKVRSLLESGRLNEASQAALALPAQLSDRNEAIKEVQAARERLAALLAQARQAVAAQDEIRAAAVLREAAVISGEDAQEALAATPLAPPVNLRSVCEEAKVKLFWQPSPGHDDGTTYVVTRTEQRPPAAVGDGTAVYRGGEHTCTDTHAQVARGLQYGVFALADGRPNSRPAVVPVTLLPPVANLEADVGPHEVTIRWSAHTAAQEVRVTRSIAGQPLTPMPVTANGCHLTGLPEGQTQHFEVTAIYRGLDGAELPAAAVQVNATPRSAAQPIPKLRIRPVEVAGQVRVRVAWTPIDNSEVRILRSDTPPEWHFGTWVTAEEMTRSGHEVTGRRIQGKAEVAIEAELPPGVHHLIPFSIGGTGIVTGRPATVGVTDPVRGLDFTAFASYATLSWEWPRGTQLAEVSWELDGEADSILISLGQYRSEGGARVPLGRGPCRVEVRAVIMADGSPFTSPPAAVVVESVVDSAIHYTISSASALGPFGGRAKKVVYTSEEGCEGVHVRMVAAPGRVMPTSPDNAFVLLDTALTLRPGVPIEHNVTVPRAVKRPYWIRCFVVAGRARLVDPPISSLKEG